MRGVAWCLARSASSAPPRELLPLAVAVESARAILVVALAESGDMVLLSPLLRELRRLAPLARITLVALPGPADLVERADAVNEVKRFHAAAPRLLRPVLLPWRAWRFARAELRDGYDVAIVPRWDTDHHLATAVALYSGAARRVGFTERSTPRRQVLNAGFDALLTDVIDSDGTAHEVERHLALLRSLGAHPDSSRLELWLTDTDRRRAAAMLPAAADQRSLVALGVGAAHPKRRWPPSRFAEVGRYLQREHGAHIVVVGGPADVAAEAAILRELMPAATGLAGRLTLRETSAARERCDLFIGNDSAPMHLAAAAGVPCVEISCHPVTGDPLHNNAPERFGPWGVPSRVLRPPRAVPPCDDGCRAGKPHCILEVQTHAVIDAAIALLSMKAQRADGSQPHSRSKDSTVREGEPSRA